MSDAYGRTWTTRENTWSGDPPTDRGPILGVAQDDLNAMRDRITALEAALATARNDALEEAARWHDECAEHDEGGLEYSSLVGIPLSNHMELTESVKFHRQSAAAIRDFKGQHSPAEPRPVPGEKDKT